jgi:zinc transporter, ZIP family
MIQAFLWGAAASSSLLAGGALALYLRPSRRIIGLVLAFAAGAILTMLADTMMPEAYAQGGRAVGLLTTLGFALAFGISSLE